MRHTSFNDPIYRGKRQGLVQILHEKGISDEGVLRAVETVPRHMFIDTALHKRAYEDTALPIGMKQTISQPYTVARQTELLHVQKGDKVLEIGTGSGYQAAILCELGASVYTVERHDYLYQHARSLLSTLGYKVRAKCGDGTEGWSAYSPYDGIVVTAGAPIVPEALVNQLHIGGRLVIPVGDQHVQTMLRITRTGEHDYTEEEFADFQFVPLIGREGWK
jgi:protein-L-isoaspartate(D-aspartate) O-methyltransferase